MSTSSTDAGAAGGGTAAPKPGSVAPATAATPCAVGALTTSVLGLRDCLREAAAAASSAASSSAAATAAAAAAAPGKRSSAI